MDALRCSRLSCGRRCVRSGDRRRLRCASMTSPSTSAQAPPPFMALVRLPTRRCPPARWRRSILFIRLGSGSQRVASAEDAEYWKEPCTSAYRSQAFHASTPGFPTAGPPQGWAPGVYVDANPTRPHVPGWMAHLANDCAVVGADATEAEILAYYATCEQKANCAMLPFGAAAPVMALVTTRDVEDGEELLTAYGHSYWVAHGGTPPPSTPAVTRAAASMWTDGLDAKVAKLEAAYADEVKVLVGLLAKGPPS